MSFESSREGEAWFEETLRARGVQVVEQKTITEHVKGGRYAYPKLYVCDRKEAFLLTFWRKKAAKIKASSAVSGVGRDLDERLKYAIQEFGCNEFEMTQCKENTLLELLELEKREGFESFLVTMYACGDIYWCSAKQFYQFSTRYGTYQQFAATPDMMRSLPYRVPTGWMRQWQARDLIRLPPAIGGQL